MRFPNNPEYIMEVSNDEKSINIFKVIDFYQKMMRNKSYQREMRDYALRYLTWEGVMAPIINIFE